MKPAECLEGLHLDGGWYVRSIRHRLPHATGGHFSVGYDVVRDDGREAYLKALDFSSALQTPDATRELEAMTAAYNFEKTVLERCRVRNMRRVVTPIADGSVDAPGGFGQLERVFYLIFESATGTVRDHIAEWQQFDLAWSLRSLHHTATGLWQLHSAEIAHQDLKPSNVLIFPEDGSKVADLGRAASVQYRSQVDDFQVPGAVSYAPPEQGYGWRASDSFSVRYMADLYLLGSLVFFYFLQVSATQAMRLKMSQKHMKDFTGSDFIADLPYIQHAFGEALADFRATVEGIAGGMTDELVMIARQLCEPDPRRRGDTKPPESKVPRHDLQPYVSRFDRLAHRAEGTII